MASGLACNDEVFVPRSRLGIPPEGASAFLRTKVDRVEGRSIFVTDPKTQAQHRVAASVVHRSVSAVVYRIGDIDSEQAVLDPLARSVSEYLKLLLPPGYSETRWMRTQAEFERFWAIDGPSHSHLVLVTHGSADGRLKLGTDGWRGASDVRALLEAPACTGKIVLSLACETGRAAFAKVLSRSAAVEGLVAPLRSVHGAVASQFCQAFLGYHFLEGHTPKTAFKKSRACVPDGEPFWFWRSGVLAAGAA